MIDYIKNRYGEWKHNKRMDVDGEEYRIYDIGFRTHPRSHDENFNRYEAIAHIVKELYVNNVLEELGYISITKDGEHVEFRAKKKYFKYIMQLQMKVV